MALELAKYQTMIVMFFAKHQSQLVIEYDKLFQQAAALDPSLRWDAIKEEIYVWALTQRHNFRDRGFNTSRLGPMPNDAAAGKLPADRATHTAAGKEICKSFNFNKCTRGDECAFAHVCWHAGCVSTQVKGAPRRYELQ